MSSTEADKVRDWGAASMGGGGGWGGKSETFQFGIG